MTIECSDTVFFNGKPFTLAGFAGRGIFNPNKFGLNTKAISTDCGRGYFCTYLIENSQLFLSSVNLWLDHEDVSSRAVPLFGRLPQRYEEHCRVYAKGEMKDVVRASYDFRIADLREHIRFSGALLLADGLIYEIDVCRGYRPASVFREVHEIIFENGGVIGVTDRSVDIQRIRDLSRARAQASPPEEGKSSEWTDRAFGFLYNAS
ncbi:hypothetical protein IV454_24760 [Massilia antarctica]|uniref:Uncharacterized protein n=1 Tax=Massilia antarctica TaxID=2765360 RepID=A0AA48WA47_9BURK|nr:hypothetical protein [Massilia antarctica]QPI48698.1 hypothetical protein IV454_24760 [Massilia antarctica]